MKDQDFIKIDLNAVQKMKPTTVGFIICKYGVPLQACATQKEAEAMSKTEIDGVNAPFVIAVKPLPHVLSVLHNVDTDQLYVLKSTKEASNFVGYPEKVLRGYATKRKIFLDEWEFLPPLEALLAIERKKLSQKLLGGNV